MKHNRIERLIQKSLDRETNAQEEEHLAYHLSQCKDCQSFYQEMVLNKQVLGGLIEFFPQPNFNERVLRKLGFRRVFAWKKAAAVFVGTWACSLLLIAFSPLPAQILSKIMTSVPALIRLSDKIELVVSSLYHTLAPVTKTSLSAVHPIYGLVLSILFIYFLGRALQKEVKCKA